MKQLNPYLTFDGNCEEALNFYQNVFGGTLNIMRFSEAPGDHPKEYADKIMHASFESDGFLLMASDGMGQYKATSGDQVHLSVNFTDEKEEEEVYNKLQQGGKVTMPLADTFWGAKFAMLNDKFGISWMLNYDLQSKASEEERKDMKTNPAKV